MGWYSSDWWKNNATLEPYNCTVEQIEQALQHSLSVDILPDARVLGDDWEAVDLGITNGEFYADEVEHIDTSPPPLNLNITNYLSQYCYDATWAFAITLNKTITDLRTNDTLNAMAKAMSPLANTSKRFGMEDFDYKNTVIVERMMYNWQTTSFIGVTGNVTFKNGLRELLRIRLTQYLENENRTLDEIHIGHFVKDNNFSLADLEENIMWKEGDPHDGSVDEVVDPLHVGVTVTFVILGVFGIVFAVVCLFLNFFLREKLVIKLSAPKLNYLIGAGAILLYINIVLVVVPVKEGRQMLASALCCTTPWFTAVGYSLCYGTILVKMFRTWYIFNNPIANKKQVQDWMLVLIVMCLVVVDIVIMAIYVVLEFVGGGASRVPNRENEITVSGAQEVVTRHYVYVCNSEERNATLGVLYGYKAVLQILALLLSFATWKVQIRGLDDSKPIIVATYVTSLVLAVVLVSTYTLTEYINVYATVFGVGFFLGTTLILCLVFMTKIYALYKDPNGEMVFVSKSGDVAEYRSGTGHRPDSENNGMNSLKRSITDSESSANRKSKEMVQFKSSE
jgi:gamma-aminobutyric acid type B receptor